MKNLFLALIAVLLISSAAFASTGIGVDNIFAGTYPTLFMTSGSMSYEFGLTYTTVNAAGATTNPYGILLKLYNSSKDKGALSTRYGLKLGYGSNGAAAAVTTTSLTGVWGCEVALLDKLSAILDINLISYSSASNNVTTLMVLPGVQVGLRCYMM